MIAGGASDAKNVLFCFVFRVPTLTRLFPGGLASHVTLDIDQIGTTIAHNQTFVVRS